MPPDAQPILPVTKMATTLHTKFSITDDGTAAFFHPTRGNIPVTTVNGLPCIDQQTTHELINELESVTQAVELAKAKRVVSAICSAEDDEDGNTIIHKLAPTEPVMVSIIQKMLEAGVSAKECSSLEDLGITSAVPSANTLTLSKRQQRKLRQLKAKESVIDVNPGSNAASSASSSTDPTPPITAPNPPPMIPEAEEFTPANTESLLTAINTLDRDTLPDVVPVNMLASLWKRLKEDGLESIGNDERAVLRVIQNIAGDGDTYTIPDKDRIPPTELAQQNINTILTEMYNDMPDSDDEQQATPAETSAAATTHLHNPHQSVFQVDETPTNQTTNPTAVPIQVDETPQ